MKKQIKNLTLDERNMILTALRVTQDLAYSEDDPELSKSWKEHVLVAGRSHGMKKLFDADEIDDLCDALVEPTTISVAYHKTLARPKAEEREEYDVIAERFAKAILTDDSSEWDKLTDHYLEADDEEKAIIDNVFANRCGWALCTLIMGQYDPS